MELTQERLKELLHYDPETGVFTWKVQKGSRAVCGSEAGSVNSLGYVQIYIDGSHYRAHRLAYMYVHGEFPEGKLDHQDQNKRNNRISNLRPATNSQNGFNQGLRTDNTSGHVGVCWYGRDETWQARIVVNQKRYHLGYFDNLEDAVAARKAAEAAFGVSEFCPQ